MFASEQERSFDDSALERRSLASILRAEGRIPVMDAVDIALDICDALASAHDHGVVHGDLGLHRVRAVWPSRGAGHQVEIFTLGEAGSAPFGVVHLVPPEQRLGYVVDPRADIWAIGALLHCMIAGAPPGIEPVHVSLAAAGTPRPVVAVIRACLEEDPNARVPSVDALVEALASFASSPPQRYEQLVRRRSGVSGAAASTVVRTARGHQPLPQPAQDPPTQPPPIQTRAVQNEPAQDPPTQARLRDYDPASTVVRTARMVRGVPDAATTAIWRPPFRSYPEMRQSTHVRVAPDEIATRVAERRAESDVRASASVGPMVLSPEIRHAISRTIDPPSPRSSWSTALVYAAAVFAIALGVGVGMHLMDRLMASRGMLEHTSAAPAEPSGAPAHAIEAKPAAPSTTDTAKTTTPEALPDVRPAAPSSLPDAKKPRSVTPVPRKAAATRGAAPSAREPSPDEPRPVSSNVVAPSAPETREDVTVTPSSLEGALR